jgi:HAD superfamily hydrolase (TIGR01509 family)
VASFNRALHPLRFLFRQRNTLPAARGLVMALEDPVNAVFNLADRVGLDGPLQRLLELAGSRRAAAASDYQLVPGVDTALQQLAPRYPLAVITVRSAGSTQRFLEHTKLLAHLRCVASGQTVRRSKPFPDQLLWAARTLELQSQDCVMVGDTTVDILAGKAAGAQAIGVLSGFGTEKELRAAGADLILPSVAELPVALGLAV